MQNVTSTDAEVVGQSTKRHTGTYVQLGVLYAYIHSLYDEVPVYICGTTNMHGDVYFPFFDETIDPNRRCRLFVCTEGETLQTTSLVGRRERCVSQWFRHDGMHYVSFLGEQAVATLSDALSCVT